MNKAELVAKIAKDTKLTKTASEGALNAVMKNVFRGAKKAPVQLVGFGTFKVVGRKARNGVNPSTGKKIRIPAKKVFVFKASKNPKF